jgi:hypothetical protein
MQRIQARIKFVLLQQIQGSELLNKEPQRNC